MSRVTEHGDLAREKIFEDTITWTQEVSRTQTKKNKDLEPFSRSIARARADFPEEISQHQYRVITEIMDVVEDDFGTLADLRLNLRSINVNFTS